MKKTFLSAAVAMTIFGVANVSAESTRVVVRIENLAPGRGTFQTPHWIGFHGGEFDIYNGGTPADFLPIENDLRRSVERLAEDGNTGPLSETFAELVPGGLDRTLLGPTGGPLDSTDPTHRFFSYASMVIPSNDFWYANGNPQAHPVFDDGGEFIAQDFFVTNVDVLDAGTEVNDELPENTAFFGQAAPDTGVEENGVILDFGDDSGLVAFRQPDDVVNPGNILADPRFAMADFALDGYPLVKISFTSAPAITDAPVQHVRLDSRQEVPPVQSRARGSAIYVLEDEGEVLKYFHFFRRLSDVQAAHLHLGSADENGPIVVDLLQTTETRRRRLRRGFRGEITSEDLTGPLTGQPLDALVGEILAGRVYINIHTRANPDGEIRGQFGGY